MRARPALLLAALPLLAACAPATARAPAAATPDAGAFRVAVLGDMPYSAAGSPEWAADQAAYRAVLDTIAATPVAFVVHVGDITGADCSDSLYAVRAREFAAMPHPLVYTFGDNEWTDCRRDRRQRPEGYDPRERLSRLRALFAAGDTSLGRPAMRLERQGDDPRFAAYRENARWRRGGVLFLTLHAVGSNNNRTLDPAEFAEREAANLAWMRDGFAAAEREGARGLVIFMQANPSVQPPPDSAGRRAPNGFTALAQELQRLAAAFGKPVALVHGDTHTFRVDKPMDIPGTGRVLTTFTRAETFGNPDHHALLMTVDPADPQLFRFEPMIVRHGR